MARRLYALCIECLRDPGKADPIYAHLENPTHYGSLLGIDLSNDVQTPPFGREHLHVVVTVDFAARHLKCPRFPGHCVVGSLSALLPVHLGREGGK
jgi:hypothetical protein